MLVDQDGFELVLPDGFVAGEDCDNECCGGCGWFEVGECDPQPQACPGPPPVSRIAYVWSCVECAGSPGIPARPLRVGDVFAWLDSCWTVLDQPIIDVPPKGALVRTETTPVQCVGDCNSPGCPRRDTAVYYLAQPCQADGTWPPVFVCGLDATCVVLSLEVMRRLPGGDVLGRMCYEVRRSNPIPGDQVPDGAQRQDVRGLTGWQTCCECLAATNAGNLSCAIGQLWAGQPGGCFPEFEDAVRPCCCGLSAEPPYDFAGRLRVSRFDVVQNVGRPQGGGTWFTVEREIFSSSERPDGCLDYVIRERYTDYGFIPTGGPPIVEEFFFSPPYGSVLPSCRSCGWAFIPYNVTPQGRLIGGPGQTWGIDCQGFNEIGTPGHDPFLPRCTANWSLTIDCDRVILAVTYNYFDPQSNQTIITTFNTEMHYEYDPADQQCNGGCTQGGGGAAGNAVQGYMDGMIVSDARGVKRPRKAQMALTGFRRFIQV